MYNEQTQFLCLLSGAKCKRERTESDDLFCEEKMLIIDGEYISHCY